MCACYKGGHSGDECDLESTLCKYDFFGLSRARVR